VSGCLGFVRTDSAFCRAASVLLVLAMHFVVLLRFFWYLQCIVSCCFCFCWYCQRIVSCCLGIVVTGSALCCAAIFVRTGSALRRAASVLLVLAVRCVVFLGFCNYWQCIVLCCLGLLELTVHCVVLLGFCWYLQCIVLLLGFCWYWQCIVLRCLDLLELTVHCVVLSVFCWY